jgi:transcriptional regulator GlxA family with amidase domain
VGLALRAARRFNQALSTQLRELLSQPFSPPSPPAPALELVAAPAALVTTSEPAAALSARALPAGAPAPPASPHQQQALHDLQQAASAALADADFGPLQLAERLALGERTLYRHTKELTGLTPAAYLRELRLQHARCLLEQQVCLSVAEVAYQSGFNDPSYFGQVFQKRFGKKPSAYL